MELPGSYLEKLQLIFADTQGGGDVNDLGVIVLHPVVEGIHGKRIHSCPTNSMTIKLEYIHKDDDSLDGQPAEGNE